jgi:hypothetical protein
VRVAPSYMILTNLRPAIPNPVLASYGPWSWGTPPLAGTGTGTIIAMPQSWAAGYLSFPLPLKQQLCRVHAYVWVALPLLVLNFSRHTPSSECF